MILWSVQIYISGIDITIGISRAVGKQNIAFQYGLRIY